MAITRRKRWRFPDGVTFVVAVTFIFLGATKVTQLPFEVNALGYYGFPVWFVFLLGIWEMLAGFGVLFRTTAFFAVVGLLLEMVGALLTFLLGDTPALIVLPLVTGGVLVMLAVYRYRQLRSLTREAHA